MIFTSTSQLDEETSSSFTETQQDRQRYSHAPKKTSSTRKVGNNETYIVLLNPPPSDPVIYDYMHNMDCLASIDLPFMPHSELEPTFI